MQGDIKTCRAADPFMNTLLLDPNTSHGASLPQLCSPEELRSQHELGKCSHCLYINQFPLNVRLRGYFGFGARGQVLACFLFYFVLFLRNCIRETYTTGSFPDPESGLRYEMLPYVCFSGSVSYREQECIRRENLAMGAQSPSTTVHSWGLGYPSGSTSV